MSAQQLKVGLLGAGYILDSHAKALKYVPGVTLHAVCDLSRGRAESAARKYSIPVVLDSIADLAASDCDVVHILLPPSVHIESAMAMVEAGKSVFLEKPMGLDSAACAALCARAAERGVGVGVNHNFLFSPGYEALRRSVKDGELGRIDHLAINWHFGLGLLQFGPFDSWMLGAPANIMFELGSHVSAFAVDLVGPPTIDSVVVGNPLVLPNGQTVYRSWTAVGHSGNTAVVLSISITTGHEDRILRVRGRGASAQFDFGRDIGWQDLTVTDNPIFDSYSTARTAGHALTGLASRDRSRRVKAALRKQPDANPFEETVFRSIKSFYANGMKNIDPRQDGRLGTNVIALCEAVTTAAGVGPPSLRGAEAALPTATVKPTVLVVGGTGFIGRRLVRMLAERGVGVRVMTRNPRAAAFEFAGLDVELFAGSHGNAATVARALEGIKVVYHLAKCEGKRWQDYVDGDIEPTRILAKAAKQAGVSRFIYTGTIASYASGDPRDVIDNTTAVDPAIKTRSHYPRSKAACEALLDEMRRNEGLPVVIVRPGIVVGPGSPPSHLGIGRFMSETRVDYWGDGATPLPLVTVDDVADALLRAYDAPGIEGQTLLLTSPPLMTAREYTVALAKAMETRIDARPRAAWRYWVADMIKESAKNLIRHPNRRWPTLHDARCQAHAARFDSSMTEKALNWKPVATRELMVQKGIGDAVEWYLK